MANRLKIMTVIGTRPEIIRLSRIIRKLDECCGHILVHTGQNYDDSLNRNIFSELGVRLPDFCLDVKSSTFGEQIGKIVVESEKVIRRIRPDRLLILGDTNSGLVSIVAKRMGISVYHMEAGNRCFDSRVPEEVNRRIIDHSSSVLMPYTHNSKENLLREGIDINRIFVVGNPINEVINAYKGDIEESSIHERLKIETRGYFLVTMHREENVDIRDRLSAILTGLKRVRNKYKMPVICSIHPRTRNRMKKYRLTLKDRNIRFLSPLGFFDFIALEQKAFCVITDSGTVQEECCIFRVPNVTIRDVTERPETVEAGSNMISGIMPDRVLNCVNTAVSETTDWKIPEEYCRTNVSSAVVKILMGTG